MHFALHWSLQSPTSTLNPQLPANHLQLLSSTPPAPPSHQLRCILVHFVFYKLTGFPLGDGFHGDICIFLSRETGKDEAIFDIFLISV